MGHGPPLLYNRMSTVMIIVISVSVSNTATAVQLYERGALATDARYYVLVCSTNHESVYILRGL